MCAFCVGEFDGGADFSEGVVDAVEVEEFSGHRGAREDFGAIDVPVVGRRHG